MVRALAVTAVAASAAAALLLGIVRHAHAAPAGPCPPGGTGSLATVSRTVVPIGVAATRAFVVAKPAAGVTVSDLVVTAPDGYGAVHAAGKRGYALRLKAPRAGAFVVHGTWSETRAGLACPASGAVELEATTGSPLPVAPPRWKNLPPASPLTWRWSCRADSDPMPRRVLIRWEFDPRTIPYGAPRGHAPFRFRTPPKTLTALSADPCDPAQAGGFTRRRLRNGAKLTVVIGGNWQSGAGGVSLKFQGRWRDAKSHSIHPLHVEVTIREGARTIGHEKACALDTWGWYRAHGKHVLCWF